MLVRCLAYGYLLYVSNYFVLLPLKKALINFQGGLEWVNGNRLCDLDYADDIALIETSQMGMQLMTEEVEKVSGKVGLRMNAAKCKTMVSNKWEDGTVITAEGTNVEMVEDFCYLGSYISRTCLLYTSPSPRDRTRSRMPSSA